MSTIAIVAGDIKTYLTIKTSTVGFSDAQPAKDASLGGWCSTTELSLTALHDLYDVITGTENAASVVDYRAMFVANTHATLTLIGAAVYLLSQGAGGADISIGLDPVGVVDRNSGSAQGTSIANELAVPSGVTFSAPTTTGAALAIGDIAPGKGYMIWIRRTAANTGPVAGDTVTIRTFGDTEA